MIDTLLFHKNNDVLVIIFSSLDVNRKENGKFDLYSFGNKGKFSTLLVRDLENSWYNMVDGKTPEEYSKKILSISKKYRTVVCFGFSMGGYAAILYGRKINASRIISVCPQVFINTESLKSRGDTRFIEHLTEAKKKYRHMVEDLTEEDKEISSNISIFYSEFEECDRLHASYFEEKVKCSTFILKNMSHSALSVINYFNITDKIIDNSVNGANASDALDELERIINNRLCSLRVLSANFVPSEARLNVSFSLINLSNISWSFSFTRDMKISALVKDSRGINIFVDKLEKLPEFFLRSGDSFDFFISIDIRELPEGTYDAYFNLREGEKVSYEDIGIAPIRLYFEVYKNVVFGDVFHDGHYTHRFTPYAKEAPDNIATRPIEEGQYPISSGQIKTDVGNIHKGAIHFSGLLNGFVFFGPYVNLEKGRYTAIINFRKIPSSGTAKLDVISKDNNTHARISVNFSALRRNMMKLEFTLMKNVENLEVRMFVYESDVGAIDKITINQKHNIFKYLYGLFVSLFSD